MMFLSRCLRQIRLWIHEVPLEQRTMMEPASSSRKQRTMSDAGPNPPFCGRPSLPIFLLLADLVVLLAAESQFVQHLAGNITVVVSEFVAASGSKCQRWSELIHILCLCLEWAISDTLPYYPVPLVTGDERFSDYDSSKFIPVLKLKNANWSMIASILRILRNIMKNFQQEDDAWLLKMYLNKQSSEKTAEDNFLEGSPFLSTFFDGEVHGMCLWHLQRQTVFFFLKCCFSLINMREEFNEQCPCATPTLCFENDIYCDPGCCSKKKGTLELYQ